MTLGHLRNAYSKGLALSEQDFRTERKILWKDIPYRERTKPERNAAGQDVPTGRILIRNEQYLSYLSENNMATFILLYGEFKPEKKGAEEVLL